MITIPQTTVVTLLTAFAKHFKAKGKRRAEVGRAITLANAFQEWYHDLLVEDFDAYEAYIFLEKLAEKGWVDQSGKHHPYTRQYINKFMNNLRQIFAWGKRKRLVTEEVCRNLGKDYLKPFKPGELDVPEAPKRKAVSSDDVEPVYKYLTPFYADILRLMERTGMRPGEIRELRWEYIDQSDDVWIYQPKHHKTAGKEQDRYIGFGKEVCQPILEKYRNETGYIFNPRRALADHWATKSANRKNPPRKSKSTGKRLAGLNDQLGENAINRAIRKAVKKAIAAGELKNGWVPYCLRHKAITEEVEEDNSCFKASKLAGHANEQTTAQHYDHSDIKIIKEIARKRG